MKNFWLELKKPFFALAPLEDVTDAAFRRLIARFGKPDVMFTEFTSADGLILASESGKEKLRKKLLYSDSERPIVAQLFSSKPDLMERAAAMIADFGFDGLDINMGCPVDEVVRQKSGAGMIQDPPLAREIIRAAKRGVAGKIPVSVKTRLGFASDEIESWLPELLAEDLPAITIHARTRKELSAVPARWGRIARTVEIRDALSPHTRIIGNGDLRDIADAREKVQESGCDGAMLGRAIFGNPWLFLGRSEAPSREEKIEALIEHLDLYDELLGRASNYALMKKHFKAYISGWDGAKELRVQLMETQGSRDAKDLLAEAMSAAV